MTLSLIIAGVIIAGVAGTLWYARSAGKSAQLATDLKQSSETTDAMLKASADAPRANDAVVGELHDGNF